MRAVLALVFSVLAPWAHAFPVERCVNLPNFLEVGRTESWAYEYRTAHLGTIAEAGPQAQLFDAPETEACQRFLANVL